MGRGKDSKGLRLGGLWGHSDFMKLWVGETISSLGAQVAALAIPLTAVIALQSSALETGLLKAAQTVPFLFAVFAGVWVDRHRRRPLLVGANVGRALVLALIPLAAVLGWLHLWYVCAVALLLGVLNVMFDTAYQSYLPSLVEREHIIEGNSKLFSTQAAADFAGPTLAGILIQTLTAPIALAVNSVTYLFSASALALIRKPEVAPAQPEQRANVWKDIAEGFNVVHRHPYLRAFVGEAATFNLFFGGFMTTVFLVYAVRHLGMNALHIGVITSAGAVGVLLGALVAGAMAKKYGLGRTILIATVIGCSIPLAYALANPGYSLVANMAILMTAEFITGFATVVMNIHLVSLRQTITPDRLLGRVNATYRTYIYGAVPVGSILGGLLGTLIGLRAALVVGGLGLATGILWILLSPVPRLLTMPAAGSLEQGLSGTESSSGVDVGNP